MSTVNWSLQHKRDTAANWTSNNPTLLAGQLGIETDGLTTTPKFKIGDGSSTWTALPYFYGGSASAQDLQNVLTVGNSSGNLSAKFGTGTIYFGATNQVHVQYVSGIELHNTTANTLVNLGDTGRWKVDAIQYMPNLSASSILSLDANKEMVTVHNTTGSGTTIVLSTSPTIYTSLTADYATASTLPVFNGTKQLVSSSGSGFVTVSAGVVSYDTNTYLTTSAAALAYQPLDSDLTSWAGVTRASGFDTFVATPSSANLASLVTDETGSGALVFGTSPTFTTNITSPSYVMSGNISSSAWTTSGVAFKQIASTYTDTTSSGTVAASYTNVFGGATIAASNSTTYTDYASLFVNTPSNGSNVSFTNGWSLLTNGGIKISFTDSNYVTKYGLYSEITSSYSATPTGASYGAYITNRITGSQNYSGTSFYGARIVAYNSSSSSGGNSLLLHYGLSVECQNTSTGTTSNMYALFLPSAQNLSSGSITTYNGLYINDQTVATNNRGIRSLISAGASKWNLYIDGTAKNYFAGDVGIGIITASAKCHVISTSEPLRIGYDASNYASYVLSSTGSLTLGLTGTTPEYYINNTGGVVIGNKAAIATNATDGFLYVPSCAGTPTGVPTSKTGKIAVVCDSTNNKMYIYSGGAWVALN